MKTTDRTVKIIPPEMSLASHGFAPSFLCFGILTRYPVILQIQTTELQRENQLYFFSHQLSLSIHGQDGDAILRLYQQLACLLHLLSPSSIGFLPGVAEDPRNVHPVSTAGLPRARALENNLWG